MARGKITDKWSAYFMYSFANTGKILEAYTEYRFLPQLTARIGQFKTMYTIENPMSPCFVELINCYSQAVNYLAVSMAVIRCMALQAVVIWDC